MSTYTCAEPADTMALASRLAALLRPGDVIVLQGGLGAGKTLFTSGLAAGLGVEETVVSPTFVLMRQYRSGFIPLVHVDVYRLGTLNEFEDLDVLEVAGDGVLVVEWGDAVEGGLPPDHLRIVIEVDDEGSQTQGGQTGSEVDRGGRLTDATLLVRHGQDATARRAGSLCRSHVRHHPHPHPPSSRGRERGIRRSASKHSAGPARSEPTTHAS